MPKSGSLLILGQSLFEVIVAVGMVAIILMGIVSLAASSVRNSSFSRNNTLATKYAQEEIEWLREQRDTSWTDFLDSINTGSCSGSFSWGSGCQIDNLFVRNATFVCSYFDVIIPATSPVACDSLSSPMANIVDITVSVSWQDAQGEHAVTLTNRLTNWQP